MPVADKCSAADRQRQIEMPRWSVPLLLSHAQKSKHQAPRSHGASAEEMLERLWETSILLVSKVDVDVEKSARAPGARALGSKSHGHFFSQAATGCTYLSEVGF